MKIRGNGKLLICGEYLVLEGAKAFALPTKLGQEISVQKLENNAIKWFSYEKETCFLECTFDLQGSALSKEKNHEVEVLSKIFKAVLFLLQKEKLEALVLKSTIEFDRNWGLGSSSTLIFCLSRIFNVDSFELLKLTFGGSGYDIACAQTDSPIVYSTIMGKHEWKEVIFNPPFKQQLFFVYLNKKMNSRNAITHFNEIKHKLAVDDINYIDSLTERLVSSVDLKEFSEIITTLESYMSGILELPTIKEELFPDYTNAIKSLGAWGGDFVMVIGDESEMTYFRDKGYETILSFDEMILTNEAI